MARRPIISAKAAMPMRTRRRPLAFGDTVPVKLGRTEVQRTPDQILWVLIRNRTRALSFGRFRRFVDLVMCGDAAKAGQFEGSDVAELQQQWNDVRNLRPFGADAYETLKTTTEYFLMHEVGIVSDADLLRRADVDEEGHRLGRGSGFDAGELGRLRRSYYERLEGDSRRSLPYINLILERLPEIPIKDPDDVSGNCYGILPSRLTGPLALELIWSYWHEEGMLAQTLNAVALRFQNVRNERPGADPLARLEIDPLRPLNNVLWGYVQNEWDRLSVVRRAYEYDHQYGLRLIGKAIPNIRSADRRSKFLDSFHNLLNLCSIFFREDDDTTVIADGFPMLNALKETHLILAHGAHNQFGDLPWMARVEMLIQQWLLARPEMREFLGGRAMVPYREPWMDRVDSMKGMMGWTDVSVTHFHDLAVFGEQILLAIRYGSWSEIHDSASAANWARYWRPEIQGYIHAYRAVTGVDLTEKSDSTLPSVHLMRQQPALRSGAGDGAYALPSPRGQRRGRQTQQQQSSREMGW
jgi:hypothetical protein